MIQKIQHLERILLIKEDELTEITKNINQFYREKKVAKVNKDGSPKFDNKGNQKFREINPSQGKLKLIQKKINGAILKKIDYPNIAHGGLKGRDSVTNAAQHKGKKFKFCVDFDNFFPSITHKHVFIAFKNNGFSPTIARILTQLCTYKYRVPQGAPTSTYISNLVLKEIDLTLQEFCKINDITYTRYIDDLTFSSGKCFKHLIPQLLEIITSIGFRINNKKTFYKIGKTTVTGIVVSNNKLDVTDDFKAKLENIIDPLTSKSKGLINFQKRVTSF